jgi:hypothetical protein
MNPAISISTSNRIAAGVTATYVRELSRRPAPAPGDGHRRTIRAHRAAAADVGRDRDDCARRRATPEALAA